MGSAQGFGSLYHLVGRFLGSILPVGPPKSAQAWATGHLLPAEVGLFEAMSGPDRRHAIGVARRAIRLLDNSGDTPTRAFVAAALLHDVGKTEARLGTFGRAVATVAAVGLGRDRVVAWAGQPPHSVAAPLGEVASRVGTLQSGDRPPKRSDWPMHGWRTRMARYLMHDAVGARKLEEAGSDVLTLSWAGSITSPIAGGPSSVTSATLSRRRTATRRRLCSVWRCRWLAAERIRAGGLGLER